MQTAFQLWRRVGRSRHLFGVVCASLVTLVVSDARSLCAQGITETIAIQGDAPPEGNGTFAVFNTPVLNDAGQISFGVTLINTADAPDDEYGIYRAEATAGSLVRIQREFFGFGIGVQNLDTIPAINNAGQVVTHLRALGLFGGDRDQYRISDGSSATTISLFGQSAPVGSGMFTDSLSIRPALNNAGQVMFVASLTGTIGGTEDDTGIFRGSDGTVTHIVREGQSRPDSIEKFGNFSLFERPALNEVGEVAFSDSPGFSAGVTDGVFRGSGSAITQIVHSGQVAPDTNFTFQRFSEPALNDAGEAAFIAELVFLPPTNGVGIFRGSGGTITQIVRDGQAAPDANGVFSAFFFFSVPALNNGGQVAFVATLTDTSENKGIFLGSGGTITQIVRKGQAAPDANGTFASFGDPALNDAGQSDWTNLQFLEPLVFQAAELPEVPFDHRATPGIDAAVELLAKLLAGGPRHFRDLLGEVNAAGLSRTTLVRAGERLGVVKRGGLWTLF